MNEFSKKCLELRRSIVDSISEGSSGHLPSAFSLIEILTTLYYYQFNNSPSTFEQKTHDPIILSKGHGCLALYIILADLGFFPQEELHQFSTPQGILGGHPVSFKVPGVEFSSGSLGHGLSFAIGKAIALKKSKSHRRVAVILGDGECNEGSIWEAALSLNKHQLNNLIIIIDRNRVQSFGATEDVCPLEPFADKWRAFGLKTAELDMIQNPLALKEALDSDNQSQVYICHTVKGQGSTLLEENPLWHHKRGITQEEINLLRDSLK